MKKVLALSLLAMAAMVSQAWGAVCTSPGGGTFCQFSTGCYEMSSEYSGTSTCTAGTCTCDQVIANCIANGSIFKGVTGLNESNGYGDNVICATNGGTWTNEGANPNRTVLGCCKWETETNCYPIYSGLDPTDGEDGETKVTACSGGANSFWSGSGACPTTCPTTPPTYDGSANNCGNYYCKWETGCVKITPDPENGITTCDAAITNCQTYGEYFTNSTCSGSSPTIKFIPATQALIVAPYGRSLHISSVREATVSLYDMSGVRVYSGKVRAGNSVFNMEKVASGSYYAIVQAGSESKKIPVILK